MGITPEKKFSLRDIVAILTLAAIYFSSGKFGLSLAFINASASAVWPPTGIALAALLLFGLRLWPGIFIGAFLVNITTQGSILTTLGIATGNTLEGIAGAWLVRRFANGTKAFESGGTVLRFFILAAIVSTAVSATIGVTTLCLGGLAFWRQYASVWLTWWLGDVISDIIIAPLIIIWASRGLPLRLRPKRIAEAIAMLLTVVLVAQIVFPTAVPIRDKNIPLGYWMLLPLLWAAFRFGPRGAATAAFVSSSLALWGTLHGYGPFVKESANLSVIFVQTFIGTITGTALILAAINAERQQAQENVRESEEKFRTLAQELEQIVTERTARLTDTVQELEAFSYSIAHDMRAPLRAMQGFGNILLEDFSDRLGDEGKDHIRRINSSAGRLDHMIRDVLDYSRMVRGEINLGSVNIEELIDEIIHSYPNLNPYHAQIHIQRPLPAVVANTAALTQAISNILGNAVKFVATGTRPHIHIRAEPVSLPQPATGPSDSGRAAEPVVRFWFEDNGIGIAPESHQRVFGMFQRLNRPELYEGTGMGLAIVRKAVERMGGRIGFESELGKGSRFWIELKRA